MRHTVRGLAAAGLLAGLCGLPVGPAGAIVIDSFNDGTLTIAAPGFDTVNGSGILGGERDMVASLWTGSFSSNAGSSGSLQISAVSSQFNSVPEYDIRYDGDDDSTNNNNFTGLNGADLTDGGASSAVRVRLIRSTTDVVLDFQFSEQKTPGENTFANLQIVLPAVSVPTDFFLPFADFVNPGCNFCTDTSPADFSNVGWIEVSLFPTSQTPFSLAIDFIDTVLDPTAVPEPAALGLFFAGLAGLGLRRRQSLSGAPGGK